MSTTTTRLGLVKPAVNEDYDVGQFNANADKVDANIGRVVVTSTTRPSAPFKGMMILETDTGNQLVHDGTDWFHEGTANVTALSQILRPYPGQLVYLVPDSTYYRRVGASWVATTSGGTRTMTSAQRQALTTAQKVDGLIVNETDTGWSVIWFGGKWRPLSTQVWSTLGINSANWGLTTYSWNSGLGAQIVLPADGIARTWIATSTVNVKGDGWWRLRRDLAAGNGKAASTTYWPNTTGFRLNTIVPTNPITELEVSATFAASEALLGDQQATVYLEARSSTSGSADIILPTVSLTAN